ncbi:MAG: antitoxin [Acidobacteriota bacterium]|nr:antitoxin [Acidobacteriota bacterium]
MQVLFADDEYEEIQAAAQRQRMTVAEWVRQSLRKARYDQARDVDLKLRAIAEAARYEHPTADIDVMLEEIDAGRGLE